jgi:glutaredoxin 2
MSLTLYHYVHCPFCIRVRLSLGYLGLSYRSEVLRYDDEATPVRLSGKKMLPILERPEGAMNESLNIMRWLDREDSLGLTQAMGGAGFAAFERLLTDLGGPIHSLAMPYWIYTPEFDPQSRSYFQKKKEEKRGPFRELYQRRAEFTQELQPHLAAVEAELRPFYQSEALGALDLLLAAHLWGLYVVPEFQFSPRVHSYLQEIGRQCHFNYHQDFWS